VLVLVPTGSAGLGAFGLATGLFLIFTVQSSLWLLGVVTELESGRNSQAALAVAEERLRFSRDVHDVLGRQLSTIAVQAELAATLAERGDARAPQHILQVRETAHDALREARELARGYRPLNLEAEIDGAVSLLRSAGITATADLDDLPAAWHEPVARVIREAVTNVLRHSAATRVTMQYADGVVAICNDGAAPHGTAPHDSDHTGGTGLSGLAEQLAPSGAAVSTERHGEEFVVRVQLARSAHPVPVTDIGERP
jgi:two-component system sensor histidine kinase DesK